MNYCSRHQNEEKSLKESLDILQPINVFFKVIDDRVQYASEANTLFTPAQFLQMEYNSLNLVWNLHRCKQILE